MLDKMIEVIKNKDVIIPRVLLYKYKELGLSDQEFIVIIYLLNMVNSLYNPIKISENIKMEVVEVLTIVSNLSEKGFLKTEMIERNGKKAEIVKLDLLYEKIAFLLINEQDKVNNSIFTKFQSEFARPITPTEMEMIKSWQESSIKDEVILEALKEAVLNGATSLKYIDKILSEWTKKGVKTKEDVEKQRKKFKEQKSREKKEVFSYDWLSDEE